MMRAKDESRRKTLLPILVLAGLVFTALWASPALGGKKVSEANPAAQSRITEFPALTGDLRYPPTPSGEITQLAGLYIYERPDQERRSSDQAEKVAPWWARNVKMDGGECGDEKGRRRECEV